MKRFTGLDFFKAGAYCLLIIGACHLIGQIIPKTPQNETERILFNLMSRYHKPVAGGKMSMKDVIDGMSFCYALFFVTLGFVNLVILSSRISVQIKKISIVQALAFGIGAIISLVYFFWLPFISFTSASILFAISFKKN